MSSYPRRSDDSLRFMVIATIGVFISGVLLLNKISQASDIQIGIVVTIPTVPASFFIPNGES